VSESAGSDRPGWSLFGCENGAVQNDRPSRKQPASTPARQKRGKRMGSYLVG
jgi:hypothetical protein